MSDMAESTRGSWPAPSHRATVRAGRAAFVWAVVYGGFALVCAFTGTPVFSGGGHRAPAGLDWAVVMVAAPAAVTAAIVIRSGLGPVPRALLWGSCALSMIMGFGLLMNVITFVFDQRIDERVATVNEALATVGAVLLAAAARADRSAAFGHCGADHRSMTPQEPSRAPRSVRVTAYAGALAFAPYAAMKTTWALGGTFAGMSGAEMRAISERNGASGVWLTLESWGLDVTAILAALGVLLLFGLVRPWGQVFPRWVLLLRGRRVPRWLPLAPALVGAATLAPYGALGVCYVALGTAGVVTVPRGDFRSSNDALLVSWIGLGAFAVYGLALIVAARSYWLRTRPACRPAAS